MRLTDRIAYNRRLTEAYKAEGAGLDSALFGTPDASHLYDTEHERNAYIRGRNEGLDILQKGEGR